MCLRGAAAMAPLAGMWHPSAEAAEDNVGMGGLAVGLGASAGKRGPAGAVPSRCSCSVLTSTL